MHHLLTAGRTEFLRIEVGPALEEGVEDLVEDRVGEGDVTEPEASHADHQIAERRRMQDVGVVDDGEHERCVRSAATEVEAPGLLGQLAGGVACALVDLVAVAQQVGDRGRGGGCPPGGARSGRLRRVRRGKNERRRAGRRPARW